MANKASSTPTSSSLLHSPRLQFSSLTTALVTSVLRVRRDMGSDHNAPELPTGRDPSEGPWDVEVCTVGGVAALEET